MATKAIGRLKPVYSLLLNPHAETRLSRCPRCESLTYPRKFALFVHVEGWGPFTQGKTCKYCSKCKMVLVQQDELEAELARAAQWYCPAALGQEYFLIGVMELKTFKAGMAGAGATTLEELLQHVSDFRKQYGLAVSPGGWYPEGEEPPVLPAYRAQRIPQSAVGP